MPENAIELYSKMNLGIPTFVTFNKEYELLTNAISPSVSSDMKISV